MNRSEMTDHLVAYLLAQQLDEEAAAGEFGPLPGYPSFTEVMQTQNPLWQKMMDDLFALAHEITIRIGAAARFGDLPALLQPQLAPAPVLRTTKHLAPAQQLELPHSEANLLIRLAVGR